VLLSNLAATSRMGSGITFPARESVRLQWPNEPVRSTTAACALAARVVDRRCVGAYRRSARFIEEESKMGKRRVYVSDKRGAERIMIVVPAVIATVLKSLLKR
jgi:hypothetical protein